MIPGFEAIDWTLGAILALVLVGVGTGAWRLIRILAEERKDQMAAQRAERAKHLEFVETQTEAWRKRSEAEQKAREVATAAEVERNAAALQAWVQATAESAEGFRQVCEQLADVAHMIQAGNLKAETREQKANQQHGQILAAVKGEK